MDDAVSFRAVPYSSIQESDRLLAQWEETLPQELVMDEYRIARSLGSPVTSIRRQGVQSVIIRTAYYHIRFTLHRPYAHIPSSLETAVGAAGKLIVLVGQTRPDFLSNTALAVPGHMNWGPFHVFSAAMFFSFQLISHPDQPAGKLFRENIKKAIACLEQSRWMPVGDKALTILRALAPLYEEELEHELVEERERKKAEVLNVVKTLAFPYQDTPYARSMDSPGYSKREHYEPTVSTGSTPSAADLSSQTVYEAGPPAPAPVPGPPQHPISSVRWVPGQGEPQPQPPPAGRGMNVNAYAPPPPRAPGASQQHKGYVSSSHMGEQQIDVGTLPPPGAGEYANSNANMAAMYTLPGQATVPMEMMGPPEMQYLHPADESSMWGASIGFGLGEWAQFLHAMQRADTNGVKSGH